MSQDISYIKQQLKSYEEVDNPFDIHKGDKVKYITIQGEDEFFYNGGIYQRMGDNKIILIDHKKEIHVPLTYRDVNGEIIYKTRLFVQMNNVCNTKSSKEYEKIIQTQQDIIEKMTIQIKKQEEKIKELNGY
tara:strand:- start:4475 stop:4870 length:396 start_codon:yes stop_codon:yes gene_type:complete